MSLSEKQQRLIARFKIIEDPHERLAAIVSRGKKWPAAPEELRQDKHRVPGCVSRVWLAGRIEHHRCQFQMEADSPVVKGLVALLCDLYNGADPAEAASFEPELFAALGLERNLSPTRLHGLGSVLEAIRTFAQSSLPS